MANSVSPISPEVLGQLIEATKQQAITTLASAIIIASGRPQARYINSIRLL
jgi:hypothetical protein